MITVKEVRDFAMNHRVSWRTAKKILTRRALKVKIEESKTLPQLKKAILEVFAFEFGDDYE